MKLASKLAVAASGLVLAFGLTSSASAATTTKQVASYGPSYFTYDDGQYETKSMPISVEKGKTYKVVYNVEHLTNSRTAGKSPSVSLNLIDGTGMNASGKINLLSGNGSLPYQLASNPAKVFEPVEVTFTAGENMTLRGIVVLDNMAKGTEEHESGLTNTWKISMSAFEVTETTPETVAPTPEPAKPAEPGKVAPTAPVKKDPVKVLPQTGDVKSHVALGVVGLITTALAGAFVFKKF